MTEIMPSINSRVRLWKINYSGLGCSFYEFYEWYIFQQDTRVYIIKVNNSKKIKILKINKKYINKYNNSNNHNKNNTKKN